MSRIDRATLWVYVLQLGGLPLSAALLPLLLWRFSMEQLALWYLIQSLGLLAAIAETALEPTLTRYITYARSGVQRLPAHGELPGEASGMAEGALMAEVVGATRWVYGGLSRLNLVVFGSAGTLLLFRLGAPQGDQRQVLLAWGLFTLGQCLGTHWYAAIPTLQGSGHAGAAFRALAVQRLTFGVTAGIGLLSMGRLEVLGIAQLAGACAGLLPASRLARSLQAWPSRSPGHPLRDAMLRSGGALWLSRLGGYLIVRANLPLASAALGLGPAGRLALTMQLMEALTQLSQAPMFAKLPKLYELRAHGALAASVAIVGRILLIGWLSFAAGSVVLLLFGADLLAMLGKPGALVATAPLALMLGGGLLELNFSMSATLLMVGNRVPFLVASLVSGLASLVLSLAALKFTNAGLLTVIAIPILVQAVYNYWKWPLECLRLFSTGYAALLRAALPSRP